MQTLLAAVVAGGVIAGIMLVGPYAPERAPGWIETWQQVSAWGMWIGGGVGLLGLLAPRARRGVRGVRWGGVMLGVLGAVNIGLAVGIRLLVEVVGENGSKIAGGVGALAAAGFGLWLLWILVFDES